MVARFITSPPKTQMGGGGLVSTLHDYWRFAAILSSRAVLSYYI